MARNQTVSRTLSNLFALNRLRKDCYYEPIRVDFSPIEKPNNQQQVIIPQYNNDGHYFTSSFILPKQKIGMEQNLKNEKNKFQSRISHYQRQIQEKTPEYKPTDNNYCQLCQEEFLCYWEHINGKYHKRMINSSKFNKDIIALCQGLQKANKMDIGPKTKPIEKKKTNTKINNKAKNQRDQSTKQPCQTMAKQSLLTMDNDLSINSIPNNLTPEQQKKLQESLKITLQLGNHSTNLLSSNTFKQFFKQS